MILLLLLLLLYETAAQSRYLNLRTEGIEELPEIRPPCRKPRTIFWISMGFLGFQLVSAGKKICHGTPTTRSMNISDILVNYLVYSHNYIRQ